MHAYRKYFLKSLNNTCCTVTAILLLVNEKISMKIPKLAGFFHLAEHFHQNTDTAVQIATNLLRENVFAWHFQIIHRRMKRKRIGKGSNSLLKFLSPWIFYNVSGTDKIW